MREGIEGRHEQARSNAHDASAHFGCTVLRPSTGPQQVNNAHFETGTRAPAREIESVRNELLEATNGERLETATESGTGHSD
jgi:hypothetical protein